jgi:DegV family protein with EDD domain
MATADEVAKGLDGKRFFLALSAGLVGVRLRQDYLNRINLFPVADGDTGTNIAVTLAYALEAASVSEAAGETLASIADAALVGARGNSGVIFAQFLSGLAETIGDAASVAKDPFVRAVENAGRRAHEAVTRPREGTILSVMRAWAEALRREASSAQSLAELLQRAAPALHEALEKTRGALPELAAAGVVDAGASGFVELVSGVERFIGGRAPAPDVLPGSAGPTVSIGDTLELHGGGEPRYRYCAEALVAGEGIDRGLLRDALQPLGDSLIVAGGERRARVHIHTDKPAATFAKLAAVGRLAEQKIDDMRLQFEVVHARMHSIAVVTDSVCDLPRELLDHHQIHVVPLHLRVGESEYLDRLTIEPASFYDLAERSSQFPSSSQPAASLFSRLFAYLATYYDSIIAIHLSSALSGTASTSARAAEALAGEKRISVIDSRQVSGSLGLVVLRAVEAIETGLSHEEIVAEAESWARKAEILVSVRTLRYMVRGGRVKPVAGALGKALNLKPIISLDADGAAIRYGKAFSVRRNVEKIVEMVARRHEERSLRCYALVHGHDPGAASDLADRLEGELGFPPLYIEEISPVIALNAGRGAVAVVTMQE